MSIFRPLADIPRRSAVAVAAAGGFGAALILAACGSQSGSGTSPNAGPVTARPDSSLTISVTARSGGTPQRVTLTCDPAGGTHPAPQDACDALAHAKNPFAPAPSGIACSMIFSGPQTASITGTWDGKHVTASYSRDNGCQTQRWNNIASVLNEVNPGGPMIPATNSTPAG
ncbi:MAG TPA: SSI family serine proteinase inhibitor [Streptosporangiaceae bacterium]|jgi:hypothetical protein